MSFLPWRRRRAEIVRVRTVTDVLIRNGLGFLVQQLALERFLPRYWRRRPVRAAEDVGRLSVPERLRRTMEDLGVTFIKVGQFLSGRADLLPPAYIEEFSKLLDAAPPVSVEEVYATIEQELGAPTEELFLTFETVPIASA
ncbi:MAG: AarF/UbiB family protein, partial [Anaerolineae bacterium]